MKGIILAGGIGSRFGADKPKQYCTIFDKEMISTLFGAENSEKLIDDLRTCSFTEFEGFVAAVDTWISAPSAAKIKIGMKILKFNFARGGRPRNRI